MIGAYFWQRLVAVTVLVVLAVLGLAAVFLVGRAVGHLIVGERDTYTEEAGR